MKRLCYVLVFMSLALNTWAQKNYPSFSIEDCLSFCLINDETIAFGIVEEEDRSRLVLFDLENKAVKQKFDAALPENQVVFMLPCDDGLLYLLTMNRKEGQRRPLFDAIYSFSYKEDKIRKVYQELADVVIPSAEIVRTKIYLAGNPFTAQPRVFDVSTKQFEEFSENKNLRLLFATDEQKGCVVMDKSTVGDDDVAPIYFMDEQGSITPTVGNYDSRMVMSSNKAENKMPGMSISDVDYEWIIDAFDRSGFPHSSFSIATRPGLAKLYNQLGNRDEVRELLDMNASYLVAKGKGKVYIYNLKHPVTQKLQSVSDKDVELIRDYYRDKTTYTKTKIQSSALQSVYKCHFYQVNETIKLDEYSRKEDHFIVAGSGDDYQVLKDKSQLTALVSASFTIEDEQEAAVFQDALNALYPPDTFDKKHVQFSKKDGQWQFIRGESFGDKKGFIVKLNSSSQISEIKYSDHL